MALNSDITRCKIQEIIHKIDNVPSEEFDQLMNQIHDALRSTTEGKAKLSEKQTKEQYLDQLVERYLQTSSERVLKILVGLSTPLNECLFNIIMNKITSSNNVKSRQTVLILISKIVHVTPAWLSQIINHNLLNQFFAILKNDEEVVILGTSALIIVEMIATLPSVMCQCLGDIFNFFSRLSTFVYKKKLHNNDANFLQMYSIVYRFFFRLYAMYPCNFIGFLKTTYGLGCNKENGAVFTKIIEPMLSRIRFHPLLITASKEKECDKQRWVYKEAHDHMDDCLQYAIDPIEFCSEPAELLNAVTFVDDNDDEELCQLTNSTSDEDKMTTTPTSPMKDFSPQEKLKIEPNPNVIFSKLNDEISLARGSDVALLDKQEDAQPDAGKMKNAEFAEEAILLSKEDSFKNDDPDSSQKFSPLRNKSVVVPVAIPAVPKTPNLGALQRKNINKAICISPFKPIKELMDNPSGDMKGLASKSPANLNSNLSHSLGAKASTDDNEEVDMEIMRISYNLENKSASEFTKNNSSFSPLSEMEAKADRSLLPPGKEFNVSKENSCSVISKLKSLNLNNDQLAVEELVGNIKNSFKKANSRIRYQSHCLPETDKEHSDFYCESPSGSAINLRVMSKSCPMLYFKSDDEMTGTGGGGGGMPVAGTQVKRLSTDGRSSTVATAAAAAAVAAASAATACDQANRPTAAEHQNSQSRVSAGEGQQGSKAKVNLMLENPDVESKRIRRSLSLKKTCKSVDYSKEARQKFQRHDSNSLLGKHSFDIKGRKDVFESTSSIDIHIPHKSDPMHWKYTPHEMLDQMLLLNSDICRKELQDRATLASQPGTTKDATHDRPETSEHRHESRRNSSLNTYSTCSSSMEQIGSANNFLCMNEENMRKQLAIMYAQLLFERHQRDLNVIRNRRLYKKLKESIELQEKVSALKDQIKLQEINQIKLETKLKEKMYDFCNYRKNMKDMLTNVEKELELYKEKCQQMESDRTNSEKQFRDEIKSLHLNHRTTEHELKRYVCSFDGKNVDLAKLETENSDLKHRLFVFGEFYTKLRVLYLQNRSVTDLNDKLSVDALKYDNNGLHKRINELSCQLSACHDRCSNLEVQLKQQEAQAKMRMESQDTMFFKDLLQMKETQIKSLKDIIVNYDKHIHALNSQLNASKVQTTSVDDAKTA